MRKSLWKSRTVWGYIVAGAAILTDPVVFNMLPREVTGIVAVIGVIVSKMGEREAIARNGRGE